VGVGSLAAALPARRWDGAWGALRALVHGLAGVARGARWPELGVAAKRTVASLVGDGR
jgi:hypothetical protein